MKDQTLLWIERGNNSPNEAEATEDATSKTDPTRNPAWSSSCEELAEGPKERD